jgi:hypothetical protein
MIQRWVRASASIHQQRRRHVDGGALRQQHAMEFGCHPLDDGGTQGGTQGGDAGANRC